MRLRGVGGYVRANTYPVQEPSSPIAKSPPPCPLQTSLSSPPSSSLSPPSSSLTPLP